MDADEIVLSRNDLGVRQGVIAVERLRTYSGKAFAVDRHLQRWRFSTKQLHLDGLPDSDTLTLLIDQVIAKNRDLLSTSGDIGITMFATPGDSTHAPTLAIYPSRIDHNEVDRFRKRGQPVWITDVVQPPAESWSRQAKVRCRIHYYLADRVATTNQVGAAGALIDSDGSVTETSTCNLAIVRSGKIVSPLREQILPGITQSTIQQLAAETDMDWEKRSLTPDDVRAADEVLLMGTTVGLWFASHVDGTKRQTSTPTARSVYSELLARFDAFVASQ